MSHTLTKLALAVTALLTLGVLPAHAGRQATVRKGSLLAKTASNDPFMTLR